MEEFILRVCYSAPGFLMAICFHEYAHAWMASRFGDNTAKSHGRLSLNPAAHYDLFGTLILPVICALSGAAMFGYARPVPVDARNFKNYRKAVFWVSFAGPLANIVLTVFSAFFFVAMSIYIPRNFMFYEQIVNMMGMSVNTNVMLAVFNLIPLPPLDGSRMVSSFLSYDKARIYEGLERYSFMFFLILFMTQAFSYLLTPAVWASNRIIFYFSLLFS